MAINQLLPEVSVRIAFRESHTGRNSATVTLKMPSSPAFCINRVYFQILECILSQLDTPERLQKTLVCRQWAEIVSHGALFENIWLVFPGSEMERAVEAIIGTQRHYKNLQIFRGTLTSTGGSRLLLKFENHSSCFTSILPRS